MLLLILADGNRVRLVDEDVGSHEHGVGEEPGADRFLAVPGLVLELRHPLQPAHGGHAGEQPGELGVLGDVRLHEQDAALRVDAGRQENGPP